MQVDRQAIKASVHYHYYPIIIIIVIIIAIKLHILPITLVLHNSTSYAHAISPTSQ